MKREGREETALDVTIVVGRSEDIRYVTEKVVYGEDGELRIVRKECLQLSFVVRLERVMFV